MVKYYINNIKKTKREFYKTAKNHVMGLIKQLEEKEFKQKVPQRLVKSVIKSYMYPLYNYGKKGVIEEWNGIIYQIKVIKDKK